MVNLDNYSKRDLQNFISLLIQYKQNKIYDIDVVLKDVGIRFEEDALMAEQNVIEYKNPSDRRKCPKCSSGYLETVKNDDGETILGCSICRYSFIKE